MKLLSIVINVFFTSATPNAFGFAGSKKRREAKEGLSKDYEQGIAETESEISRLKSENPFESAAARSAMSTASRKAKESQKRFANIMGGNTNPEAMIAAQQASQEAVAGTAGDIAVGAEASKQARLDNLRSTKLAQQAQKAQISAAAANEYGSGWRDFFKVLNPIAGGFGGAMGASSQQ